MQKLRVKLLGSLEVRRGDAVVVPGARLRGLITRLALGGGRPVGAGCAGRRAVAAGTPADPTNALFTRVSPVCPLRRAGRRRVRPHQRLRAPRSGPRR